MTPMVVEITEWHDVIEMQPPFFAHMWVRTVYDEIEVGIRRYDDYRLAFRGAYNNKEITHWTELKVPRFE